MYKIAFSFFFLIAGNVAWCQEGNYVYIDSDKGIPFYIKLQDKILSSSQSGHIILAGIKEKNPGISIGFPGNRYPEQRFTLPVNNSDRGFHLRNTGDRDWELLDLNTLAVIKNVNPPMEKEDTNAVKKTDAFSILLSRVVNDPAVLIASTSHKEPPVSAAVPVLPVEPASVPRDTLRKETVATISRVKDTIKSDTLQADTSIALKKPPVKDSLVKETVVNKLPPTQDQIKIDQPAIVATPSPVRKLFDQQFEKRYEATYIDQGDTVKISYLINTDTVMVKQAAPVTSVTSPARPAGTDSVAIASPASPSTNAAPAPVIQDPAPSGCRLVANEQDVDNLRVKILEAKNTDDKISVSETAFRSKCFSVRQIKALSELFAGDEDKYRLFDAVYPYTSDSNNFPSLAGLIKEDYYRNRFKAIIRR